MTLIDLRNYFITSGMNIPVDNCELYQAISRCKFMFNGKEAYITPFFLKNFFPISFKEYIRISYVGDTKLNDAPASEIEFLSSQSSEREIIVAILCG